MSSNLSKPEILIPNSEYFYFSKHGRSTATTEPRGLKTFIGIKKKRILNPEIIKQYHPVSAK
ncbi:MAG TPA: hypothetical protein DIT10_08760 [Chryseobacterium sp.]|nr:hypothetical protein [Chryseobacterium sp.]